MVIAGGIFAFIKFRGNKENTGPAMVKVTKDNIVEIALAIGKIEPRHIIAVKSKVSGIVEQLHADIGDRAKKGQLLITVKPQPTPLELAETKRNLELADVDLEMAEKDLERARQLFDQGLQAQEEYDRVQQNYKAALLRKRMAEDRLALLEEGKVRIAGSTVESVIRAPITVFEP